MFGRSLVERVLAGLVPLTFVLACDARAAEVSPGTVRFALCRTNIASTSLFKAGEQWGILVKIDRAAARQISAAARSRPGATLDVVMGDYLLHRAPIASVAGSGSFTSMNPDLESARRDLAIFRSNVYEGPCGVVEEPGA